MEKNVTWKEIESMLEEKRLELIEDAKYIQFVIEEMKKILQKYEKPNCEQIVNFQKSQK